MATFLDLFPKIQYKISGDQYSSFETITNLSFRFSIIKSVLDNISSYFSYTIKEGDKPEILAEKIYSDPEAYWIITYANDIFDVNYDWPLDYDPFNKYIISKYGSISSAQSTVHHYEKVVTRTIDNETYEQRFIINYNKITDTDLPYDYYLGLAEDGYHETFNLNGKTVRQVTSRNAVSNYDFENSLNEAKREIKIIKPEYYQQIMAEFNAMTSYVRNPHRRTL